MYANVHTRPPHLDSFRADFDASKLYDRNLVLVAPGMINLQPGQRYVEDSLNV